MRMSRTQKYRADKAIEEIHELLYRLDENFHADEEGRGGYSRACLLYYTDGLKEKAELLEYIINNHYEEDEIFKIKE